MLGRCGGAVECAVFWHALLGGREQARLVLVAAASLSVSAGRVPSYQS